MGCVVGGGHILWRGVSPSHRATVFITQAIDGLYSLSPTMFPARTDTFRLLDRLYCEHDLLGRGRIGQD